MCVVHLLMILFVLNVFVSVCVCFSGLNGLTEITELRLSGLRRAHGLTGLPAHWILVDARVPRRQVDARVPPFQVDARVPPRRVDARVPPYEVDARVPPLRVDARVPPFEVDAHVPPRSGGRPRQRYRLMCKLCVVFHMCSGWFHHDLAVFALRLTLVLHSLRCELLLVSIWSPLNSH